MSPEKLSFDKDCLLAFYEQIHNNRRDYVERMWGTVQYFTTVVTSLVTLSIGGAFVLLEYGGNVSTSTSFGARISLDVICLIAAGLSLVGLSNLKRECENEYVQMALIISTERVLGLQKKIPKTKRFFNEESFLVPHLLFLPKESFPGSDPSKIQASTIDEFVNIMISKKRSFYAFFRRVFHAFILFSVSLSIVFTIWAFFS
jgi:hypothetical protein